MPGSVVKRTKPKGKQLGSQFDRRLDRLLRRRTAPLERDVLGGRGGLKKLTRPQLRAEIDELEELAHKIFVRTYAKPEIASSVDETRRLHPKAARKGRGFLAKKASFRDWYERRVGSPHCVYVFWSGKRCEYVGRTIRGKGRPAAHIEKVWFKQVTRIDIHVIARASEVPKVECLMIDLFEPRRNRVKSSNQHYASKCPVCSRSRKVRRELWTMFQLQR